MAEFDLFNLSVSDVDLYNKEAKKETSIYSPSADKGKDGTYRSLIRFIPNPKNPTKSIVRKFTYWLEDPSTGNKGYFDCPSTVGEKSPIQDLFFKLRNSESAVDKKMSESLKRREVFYSIIQVVKDPQDTEQEGKFKIFKYGYKIKQKIDDELNPQFDTPTQIFDLFEGKNFELNITKQGGFNNYDTSKFQSKTTAVTLNGKPVENSKGGRVELLKALEDAPLLEDFEYKTWTDEERTKLESILSYYRSPGSSMSTITSTKSESSAPKQAAKPTAKPVVHEEVSVSDEEDLNTFLNDLDL